MCHQPLLVVVLLVWCRARSVIPASRKAASCCHASGVCISTARISVANGETHGIQTATSDRCIIHHGGQRTTNTRRIPSQAVAQECFPLPLSPPNPRPALAASAVLITSGRGTGLPLDGRTTASSTSSDDSSFDDYGPPTSINLDLRFCHRCCHRCWSLHCHDPRTSVVPRVPVFAVGHLVASHLPSCSLLRGVCGGMAVQPVPDPIWGKAALDDGERRRSDAHTQPQRALSPDAVTEKREKARGRNDITKKV